MCRKYRWPPYKTRAGYLRYNSKYEATILERIGAIYEEEFTVVGIDVDNKAYYICVYNPLNDEIQQFKGAPSPDLLICFLFKASLSWN